MTAFEQWANYFRENYRAFNPDEHDIAELAFDAALEHAAKIVEGGHFLHDQAPAKLFSIEVARAIRKEIAHHAPAVPVQTSLERYLICTDDAPIPEPIERLHFFLSFALNGQDWLDVERFIDDLSAPAVPNEIG